MAMIDVSIDENVALLAMNNSENRFNLSFINEFLSMLDHIENNTDVKALVVKSNDEKIWSNGMDLDWLMRLIQNGETNTTDIFFAKQNEFFQRVLFYPMITVAAITGHAFAAGAILACCFDFRFMRKGRGFLCLPEVDLGIPFLPSATAIIKKAIPIDVVIDMQLTAKRLTAEECEAHRIIRKACAMEEVVGEAIHFAKGLNKKREIVSKLKNVMYMDIQKTMEVEDPIALKSFRLPL